MNFPPLRTHPTEWYTRMGGNVLHSGMTYLRIEPMTEHNVKGRGRAHRAWQSLKLFGVVGAAALRLVAPAHAAPAIGAPTANTTSVGRYNLLELTFPVTTVAVSPFLPYDPSAPPYAVNLRPTEDARDGVSVDALLLPPGQTQWSKAQVWPCYWQEDFNEGGVATGTAGWHLRFAPTQVGTWHYILRATDASGTDKTGRSRLQLRRLDVQGLRPRLLHGQPLL